MRDIYSKLKDSYYIRQMYIERLKTKYKQILQSSRAETDQEDECASLKDTRAKNIQNLRVLTEYSENMSHNSINNSSAYILALKQRLAQATHNMQKKDMQVGALKEEIIRKDQKVRLLQTQIQDCQNANQQGERKLAEAKMYSATLEKDLETMKNQIEAIMMDRQLLWKQSEFYKGQTAKVSKEKKNQHKQIEFLQKSLKEISSLKAQNKHLKQDVKRMQEIINQMCQNKIAPEFTDKHYLGKPMKENSMWFSQNLIGEVEHFLKKEQIGHANKKFTNNLVKFIDKYTASLPKTKATSSTNSRVKTSNKSSHCRSASMCDPGFSTTMYDMSTSSIKKTQALGTSILKKSLLVNKYKKLDSRKFTTDSIQLPQSSQISICEQILKDYRKALEVALGEKVIKSKTVLDLTDEMSGALMELLQSHGY